MTPESVDIHDPLVPHVWGTIAGCAVHGGYDEVATAAAVAVACRWALAAELRAEQAELAKLGCVRAALAMGEAAAIVAGDRRHP